MKKYIKLVALLCILFMVTSSVLLFENLRDDASTLNQREKIINQIKPGAKIVSEIENYIISGFELLNDDYGLAIFSPDNNSYKFQSCIYSNSEESVNLPLNIGNKSYLIIWSNNPSINRVLVKFIDENDIELDFTELTLSKYEIVVCSTQYNNFSFEVVFLINWVESLSIHRFL